MPDRLTDLVLGLQRMAEGAHMRTEDLEYTQREERAELAGHLDHLLTWVDKLRASLLEDRRRLEPPQRRDQIPQDGGPMPRIVKQGPKEAAG